MKHNMKNNNFLVLLTFVIISNLSMSQEKLETLVQKCKPYVFSITTYDDQNNSLAYGTGFFIDSKGTGITNYHILEGAKSAKIKTLSGAIYTIDNIVSQSESMDLIKFTVSNSSNELFPFIPLSQTKPIEGEAIFVIGNPKGFEYSVTDGIVSSVRYDESYGQIIQMTAPISSGNSGSPVINMKGQALGVVSFTLIEGQSLNFAISVSNFMMMSEVDSLKFPEKKNINVDENMFRRFDWNATSSFILKTETLTFSEKKGNASDSEGFELIYLASLAGIEFEISYNFKFDELTSIYIVPVRRHPKASPTSKKGRYYLSDVSSIYNEFATIETKLINTVGSTFHQCVGGIAYFCQDKNFIESKSQLITEAEIRNDASLYFKEEKGNGFGYESCIIMHRWLTTNSKYVLGFNNTKEPYIVNGQEMQADWYLRITPNN